MPIEDPTDGDRLLGLLEPAQARHARARERRDAGDAGHRRAGRDERELSTVEIRRAQKRQGLDRGDEVATALLSACDVVRLSADLLDDAGAFPDPDLGSLDAIHLATALRLGDHLDQFVTHDATLAEIAARHGLTTSTPS